MTLDQAFDLALQHHQAGRLAKAEPLYQQILAQQPNHADALHMLGVVAHQAGRHDSAVELIGRAIALRPDWPEALCNLGAAFLAARNKDQLNQAIAAFRRALTLNPGYPEAHCNLGVALLALKDPNKLDEAIAAFHQAIALKPTFAEAWSNLGNALKAKGQRDQAIAAFRKAIALKPAFPEPWSNIGNALVEAGQLDEAIAAYRQAIALNPQMPEVHSNLGNALTKRGKLDDAIAACHQAISLDPGYPEAHSNLGAALTTAGQLDLAIGSCRRAIALKPDYAEAHYNLSTSLLLKGDFPEGWAHYEWRWRTRGFPTPRPNFTQPQWDGSLSPGATLLLYAEQGLGDTIQFIRYVQLAAQRCGRIMVQCSPPLHRLFRSIPHIAQWLASDETPPPFDFYCPLLSLPLALGTKVAAIPNAVPYLKVDPKQMDQWRQRFESPPRPLAPDRSGRQSPSPHHPYNVGLAWAGRPTHENDRNRSIPLATLAPLAKIRGVTFYSLQLGEAAQQAQIPPAGMTLIDWTQDLHDFTDTAALIANLDLVISVDTAIVHLAGALGKQVWTLLPFIADWRWLLDRDDSPWYPTMRLFRQRSRCDWAAVVARVAVALRAESSRGIEQKNS